MHADADLLGDEGRKGLDACVKVKIYGKPEDTLRYDRNTALQLLSDCYAGWWDCDLRYSLYDLFLPREFGEDGKANSQKTYDIVEIYEALVNFDKVPYLEKYPEPGPRYDELKELIDKRRAAIDRECQEAVDNRGGKRQYSWLVAQHRVRDCFAGSFARDYPLVYYKIENPRQTGYEPHNIIDIYDAVVLFDEMKFVEMFPLSIQSDWKAHVEGRYEEAPDKSLEKYTRYEAEQLVKSCFHFCRTLTSDYWPVGLDIFPIQKNGDESSVKTSFNEFDINKACEKLEAERLCQKYPENDGPGSDELRKSIEENRNGVRKEYEELKSSVHRYSPAEAEQRVRDCFKKDAQLSQFREVIFPVKGNTRYGDKMVRDFNQTYDIFDIKAALDFLSGWLESLHPQLGEAELSPEQESVTKFRKAVKMEYETAKRQLFGYTRDEADHRVRDCFAYVAVRETDIFPSKEENKIQQTYDIFEIKNAVDYFDEKKLLDRYADENDPKAKKANEAVDKKRTLIKNEYAKATKKIEIEHGSGFIIQGHFVMTNKHVIEGALFDKTKEIWICNAIIGVELTCEIAHSDAVKDLALLYCQELDAMQHSIRPLAFSNLNESLLPGMQIFSCGYPMSHTGEEALFVSGNVSGFKKTYSGQTMAVLNCSLNSGNSGGPVLCWMQGQLRVAGVATQKHCKDILTVEEREEIEGIRESMQTSSISGSMGDSLWCDEKERKQIKLNLLTLKLYDALETHSQFNLSNAVPGCYILEFIEECISKYNGEGKEELTEVVKWSEDHINVLPSGEHTASECCIQ